MNKETNAQFEILWAAIFSDKEPEKKQAIKNFVDNVMRVHELEKLNEEILRYLK